MAERGSNDAAGKIDAYIGALEGWKGTLSQRIRAAVLSADARITEAWKWDTPVWEMNGGVCALAAFKDHLKVNFFKGAQLVDADGLFNAGLEAKKSRAIDLQEASELDLDAFKELVASAVMLNG